VQLNAISELAKALPVLKGRIGDELLSKAESLYRDLSSDRTQDKLLHGDLHHDNILLGQSGWKAIDPQGYAGDPVFEVGAMIYNPLGACPVERRLKILAEELPFDRQRIRDWAFCRTLLCLAWHAEDHGVLPGPIVEVAKAIDSYQF